MCPDKFFFVQRHFGNTSFKEIINLLFILSNKNSGLKGLKRTIKLTMFIFGPIQRLLYPGLLNPALSEKFLFAAGFRAFMIYFPAALGDTAQASKILLTCIAVE